MHIHHSILHARLQELKKNECACLCVQFCVCMCARVQIDLPDKALISHSILCLFTYGSEDSDNKTKHKFQPHQPIYPSLDTCGGCFTANVPFLFLSFPAHPPPPNTHTHCANLHNSHQQHQHQCVPDARCASRLRHKLLAAAAIRTCTTSHQQHQHPCVPDACCASLQLCQPHAVPGPFGTNYLLHQPPATPATSHPHLHH